jgi:serine/threonine-protein kinase
MITTRTDDDGRTHDVVKVCDFGIAKTTDKRAFTTENDGKALTSSGMLIGTPEYMSPEQARGDPLDARSDLYSLGIVLYQLLTSRVPFTAENALGIVLKQVTDEPDPPEKRRPGVHPRLAAIALKALRKSASDRYQTAKEMRADLRAVFGYRAPMQSTESSGEIVVPRSDPEIHNAATIVAGAEPKRSATSDGTEISIPVHSTRRALAGVLAAIAALTLLGVGIFFGTAKKTDGAATSASAANANATTTTTTTGTAIATVTATATDTATTTTTTHATANTRLPPGTRVATSPAHADPSVAASGPPPPASTAAPSNYNPAGANVALGSVTTERVTKDAIRGVMGPLVPRLTQCYQDALRTAGAPIAGTAGIQMSIDASGSIVSIVDAPKLPELQRCAATVMRGARIAPTAVESGGGIATQWLVLNP